MASKGASFFSEITEAISHFQKYGFRSQAELESWVQRIRRAALLSLQTPEETERKLREALGARYTSLVTKQGLLREMPEVSRMTLDHVKPKLRRELDRRIMASTNLIKLNREEMMSTTLRRFQGWATSIPDGGSRAVDKVAEKEAIRKPLSKMPYIERRVIIDQSHKLVDSIRDIVAVDGGAIAGVWDSPWRRRGYDYREDHKERDQKVFAIRGCWAIDKGLMKAGDAGYTDQITRPGEEVNCSCTYRYVFNLRSLPTDMLTKAGFYSLPVKSTAAKA
jgi:hypothetical protein